MFFNLTYVEDHRIYELQVALRDFFQRCTTTNPYNLDCFPDWFAEVLQRSARSKTPKLHRKFEIIAEIIQNQNEVTQQHIFSVFDNNNHIRELCENKEYTLEVLQSINWKSGDVTYSLITEIKELFDYLFDDVLERKNLFGNDQDFSIRHHHQEFRKLNGVICPFCGMEAYPDMKAEYDEESNNYIDKTDRRANYDHYLAKSFYPFAAVNFQNLVPMCEVCNGSTNKGATDILFTSSARDTRRQVFYPYSQNLGVKLSVQCIEWSISNRRGKWRADITPLEDEDSEKIESWDSIFDISNRIAARIRNYNNSWLRYFLAGLSAGQCDVITLREILKDKAEACGKLKTKMHNGVVMEAYFNYLADDAPDEEVTSFCNILGTGFMKAFDNSAESMKE